jgi:hypothetical protein
MCSTHCCISYVFQSSVSKIFGAGKVNANAELASAWHKQKADVVRGLHTGLFFIGHDCRPMCSVGFLSKLPLVSTLSSTAPSEASSSTDLAIKKEQVSPTALRSSKRKREEDANSTDADGEKGQEDADAASALEQVCSVR